MKKLISTFLIFSILIVSLTGCNVSPQNNVQTNSSALAAYQGVDEFLLDCIETDQSFMSSKLSNIDSNSFEQTYYHLKIQKYSALTISETTTTAFQEILNEKLEKDITHIKYVDVLNDFKINQQDVEKYISENPEITKDTIEGYFNILKYFGKNESFFDKSKIKQFLESSIPTETDYANRLVMIYWYLNLCNSQLIDADDSFKGECKDYLSSKNTFQFNSDDFYKYENLYYYIWNCQALGISTSIYDEIIGDIPEQLPYIFLSSELYYAVMCLDIEKQNFDAEEYFSSYYDFITPTVDDLYPSYVVEYNNIIEQYQAFILLKYAFDSDDQRVVELGNYLKEQTKNNLFATESSAQSYYECLFCILEGIQIPDEKLDLIRERLEAEKGKGNEAHNTKVYYYYLILNNADVTISEADKEYILSQYRYLKSEQTYDLAVDFLKLISELNVMSNDEITEEYKDISESVGAYYNLLELQQKLNMQPDFTQDSLSQKVNLANKCLIKDDAGVMYISTIYSDIMSTQSENIGVKFS